MTAQNEISSVNDFTRESTRGPNFATARYIDASSAGLVGDGRTNNTAVLQSLLGSGDRTIHIPAGDYVTDAFEIPPNTALLLDSGVILRDSGHLGPEQRLVNIETANVYISGYGAKVLGDRDAYPPGEQRHGVLIWGAKNVVIQGLESSENAGDGFYIGGPTGQPADNILLDGCLASENRRQGLSITSARNVDVVDSQFQSTHGTAPQFGIDLEPNTPDDFLDHILILRPSTLENVGGGIAIYLENLTANSYPIDIEILEHLSQSESPPLATLGSPYVPGTIQYTKASTVPPPQSSAQP
ncbi:MAG TPA: right-handed parallel beta-helix repeat-containing protein [Steroidobacteraceae bacterium]|nr:right-handed parallel beta-helix repeat-containing protein [Steroidobacteraceae bacterium]